MGGGGVVSHFKRLLLSSRQNVIIVFADLTSSGNEFQTVGALIEKIYF